MHGLGFQKVLNIPFESQPVQSASVCVLKNEDITWHLDRQGRAFLYAHWLRFLKVTSECVFPYKNAANLKVIRSQHVLYTACIVTFLLTSSFSC